MWVSGFQAVWLDESFLTDLGCESLWCPCILYGRTQKRRAGVDDPSYCNGSVSSFPGSDYWALTRLSVLVVVSSLVSASTRSCSVPLEAACVINMEYKATDVTIAWRLFAVHAVRSCRRRRRLGQRRCRLIIQRILLSQGWAMVLRLECLIW